MSGAYVAGDKVTYYRMHGDACAAEVLSVSPRGRLRLRVHQGGAVPYYTATNVLPTSVHRRENAKSEVRSGQYDAAPADAHLEAALAKLRTQAAAQNWPVPAHITSQEAAALLAKIKEADRLEWQPIETAPKDGAEFQAWLLDAGRQHGWWEPRCRFNDDGAFQVWQRVDYDDDGWDVIEARPTHWLPEPTEPPAYRNPQPAGGGE